MRGAISRHELIAENGQALCVFNVTPGGPISDALLNQTDALERQHGQASGLGNFCARLPGLPRLDLLQSA